MENKEVAEVGAMSAVPETETVVEVAETGEVPDIVPAGYPRFTEFEKVKVKGHNFQVWKINGRQLTLRYLPPKATV